ncbi:MAG: hypothetical protein K8S99_14160 [Planctomycetes bacterium]|nr:hypothetical protein [Planctomycetota bacterium]
MDFSSQWLKDFGLFLRRGRRALAARKRDRLRAAKARATPRWSPIEALESRALLSTAIVTGIDNPVNAAPDSATIVFSEAVTNVDLSNITLRKSGILITTPGGAAITDSGDGITWNLTGISAAFSTDGTYKITVLRDGIIDIDDSDGTDGLTSNASTTFVLDTAAPAAPTGLDLATASDSGSSNTDDLTSDATPTITGTAEADSDVELFDGVTSVGTTTADNTGAWSITSSALTSGDRSLTAKATDAAGNTSVASATLVVTIDTAVATPIITGLTSATDTGASDTDGITSNTAPTLAGTAEPDATVEIFDGDTSLGTATTDGSGDWTFDTGTLTVGDHSFTAVATDVAGNVSTASSASLVTVDTGAPAAPAALTLDPASDSGTLLDSLTSDTTPTITGTAEADSAVALFDGVTSVGTATANGSGAWSITTSVLGTGPHTLTAKATDTAGNTGVASAALVVTIDTTAPSAPAALNLVDASDSGTSNTDDLTNDATPTITGTAEAGATVELFDDLTSVGTAVADGSGNWSITSSALSDGEHPLTAKATDAAGNTGVASSSLVVTTDATAPDAPAALDLATGSDSGSSNSDDITSDTTPTITGTAEAFSTVELFDGDTSVGTAVADLSGDWSITTSALSSGVHTLTAKATDEAGNTSVASASLDITIDTTVAAPVITGLTSATDTGSSNTDGITGDTTPTLAGTAEANASVEIFDGVTSLGTATADGSGAWTFDTGTLTEDEHSFTAVATDVAGNVSATSAASVIEVDITAPDAPLALDLADASDSGSLGSDDLTSDNTPTITGTAEAGSLVELFDGSSSLGTATADGSGNWSITSSLGDGAHTLTAKATDAAGNTSAASASLVITIDTTAPDAPAALDLATGSDSGSSNSDDITSDTTPTITGTAEADSTVELFDGNTSVGTATADGSGNWSITSSALSEGAHALTAKATDAAGNTSAASAALDITIETTVAPPVIAGVAPGSDTGSSDTDNITNSTAPTLTGTAEPNSSIELFEGSTSFGSLNVDGGGVWTFNPGTISEGDHTFTVVTTDRAGNVSAASAPLVVTVDVTAPAVPTALDLLAGSDSGASNTDDLTSDATPTITGLADVGSTVELFDGVNSVGTATADSFGYWTITSTTLSDGVHNLTATATDTAGNTSSASTSLVVTIDTTAPDAPAALDLATLTDSGPSSSDGITFDTTPTVTGTAEADSTVELFDDVTSVGTATADGSGAWSITSSALSEGDHTLTAKATDAAGNTGVASAPLDITIDTTGPTATITAVTPDPRSSPVNSITIVFSEAVTGLDLADLTLTRNSGANLLTGSQTLTTSDNITWTLGNLAPLTNTPGAYTVTFLAVDTGVIDAAGNDATVPAADSFTTIINSKTPTLTSVKTLKSAIKDVPFTITYADLLSAANEKDKDAGTIFTFRIDSVTSGTLTKNGSPVVAGTTTLAEGESLVWTPPAGKTSAGLGAFKVSVTDGATFSKKPVQVKVKIDKPKVGIVRTADAAEAGPTNGTFTVTRNGNTTADLIVKYSVSGKAKKGTDYVTLTGTVTILAGQTTATITVTPLTDAVNDPNETVKLTLKTSSAYAIDSLAKLATLTIV